jgi:hypothetical protein
MMRQFQVLQGGSFSSMVLLSSRNRISVVTLELLKHCTDFWGNNRGAFLFSCAGLVFQRFSYFPRTARFIFETSAVSQSQCSCTYFSVATMYRPCRLERGLAATTTQLSPPPPASNNLPGWLRASGQESRAWHPRRGENANERQPGGDTASSDRHNGEHKGHKMVKTSTRTRDWGALDQELQSPYHILDRLTCGLALQGSGEGGKM